MNDLDIRSMWQKADAVCFDVDSTVYPRESLDEFAEFLGVSEEVREITERGMNGQIGFQCSLMSRLTIMQPTRKSLEEFVQHSELMLTPNIDRLVSKLQERRVDVFLVSGGFNFVVSPIAAALRIPEGNVFCNSFLFDQDGRYIGIDHRRLTSLDNGKKLVLSLLKSRFRYKRLIMIGDGSNDLDACPPADGFIGFGGNVVRSLVLKKSPWFVYGFDELIAALDFDDGTREMG